MKYESSPATPGNMLHFVHKAFEEFLRVFSERVANLDPGDEIALVTLIGVVKKDSDVVNQIVCFGGDASIQRTLAHEFSKRVDSFLAGGNGDGNVQNK